MKSTYKPAAIFALSLSRIGTEKVWVGISKVGYGKGEGVGVSAD